MLFYWLVSGFVFFIKKYRFSKFTSANQRFWRRVYIIFWALESFTFLIFFYLLFNSNAEPQYIYDVPQTFKTHLLSWRFFIYKLIPVVALVVLSYSALLRIRWGFYNQVNSFIVPITLGLFYILWLEFYQFYHLLSFYRGYFWLFDMDERIWLLEPSQQRARISTHYVTICYIAKF